VAFPGKKQLGSKAKSPKPGVPLNRERILELIPKLNGNLSRIADLMSTHRHTVRHRIDSDPELKQALDNARERRIDELEEQTHIDALERQDATMRIFLLKTLGKNRGYDQEESRSMLQDITRTAFEFVLNKSKNPVGIDQTQSKNPSDPTNPI